MNFSPTRDRSPSDHPDPRSVRSAPESASRQHSPPESPLIASPHLGNREARSAADYAAAAQDPIGAEIETLMDSLTQIDLAESSVPVTVRPGPRPVPATQQDLQQTLGTLLEHELSRAATGSQRQRLGAIQAAITLLPGVPPDHRHASIHQLIGCLEHTGRNDEALDCAIELIESFAAYPCCTERNLLNDSAALFARQLITATATFPFEARCRLVVKLLHASTALSSFAMAKATFDELITRIGEGTVYQQAQQIGQVAARIPSMPQEYRTLATMKLYERAPENGPLRLATLEALAANSVLLGDAQRTTEFCLILNQEIFRLRIAAAADVAPQAADNH